MNGAILDLIDNAVDTASGEAAPDDDLSPYHVELTLSLDRFVIMTTAGA